MKKLKIKTTHLHTFSQIINTYEKDTKFPKPGRWKDLSNNEIWFWMVGQIMVVGSSGGGKRFWQNESLRNEVAYDLLLTKKEEHVKKLIHAVLRKAGARYASPDISRCAKTNALLHNYKFVKERKNGFKELLSYLHEMDGESKELDRVYYLMDNLKFFKNKSARDFLMNLGMNQNTLAIDIRIQNIFQHLKIDFPEQQAFGNNAIYEAIEQEIITKVCHKLNINPLYFDRILYQHYFKILKNDYLQIKFKF